MQHLLRDKYQASASGGDGAGDTCVYDFVKTLRTAVKPLEGVTPGSMYAYTMVTTKQEKPHQRRLQV